MLELAKGCSPVFKEKAPGLGGCMRKQKNKTVFVNKVVREGILEKITANFES